MIPKIRAVLGGVKGDRPLPILQWTLRALVPGAMLLGCNSSPEPPKIVFVTGDHEYRSERTMPLLAAYLEENYGVRTTVLRSDPDEHSEENIPGLEALADADLAVFYLRWRRLPPDQMRHIESYLDSGKPVVGFRTSTHAFNYPAGHELEEWNRRFGVEALGAPPGWGGSHFHYGDRSTTDVVHARDASGHPILTGVDPAFHVRSWLYHVRPDYPPEGATVLLMGSAVGSQRPDPVDNPVAWTYQTPAGGRIFTTTIGHPEDFQVEAVQRLVVNGILWSAGREVPSEWAGPADIQVR
jgi:type 1 glutamine amidotransferase